MDIHQLKVFMTNRFAPALHQILFERNPVLFTRWQGNCCVQMAVTVAHHLRIAMPSYRWDAFEGQFSTVVHLPSGDRPFDYNHAWVFGTSKDFSVFIDLAHRSDKRVFEFPVSRNSYPFKHEWVRRSKVKLDISDMVIHPEYFTSMTGLELYDAVLKRAMSGKVMTDKELAAIRPEWND